MTREEKIDMFLLGRMSDEARNQFEAEMENDAELARLVEVERTLMYSIETMELKNKLKAIAFQESQASSQKPEATVRNLFRRNMAIAASLLVLISAGLWMWNSGNNSGSEIDNIFYADAGLPTKMSDTDHYVFYDGMVDYKREEYTEALSKWDNVNSGIGEDTIQYYQAMALIGLNNYEEAIAMLGLLTRNSDLYYNAKWYEVFCLIKQGKNEEARKLLQLDGLKDKSGYEDVLEIIK